MQMLIFTGAESSATAITTAATAAAAAQAGTRTLLASVGPTHGMNNIRPGPEPQTLAPNLDAWALDALSDLATYWNELRRRVGNGSSPAATIAGDELPIIPGSDLFLAVARLRRLGAGYDLVCVDAGVHAALLRALAVPDTFRWSLRLLFGLDRGPGRSSASVSRAIVPGSLLPFEWLGQVQQARADLEQLRDATLDPVSTRVRYVVRPDPAGLHDAQIAVPALQLFGLAVEALIAGPLLPAAHVNGPLAALSAEQSRIISETATIWPERPLHSLPLGPSPTTPAELADLGATLYADSSPLPAASVAPPIMVSGAPDPSIALSLPGLRREDLGLTLSGDELIVRAGPYRRHVLMPDGLRGAGNIKATRQGDTLIVRPRTT
jgi:anion-transporting  ArsA/GET3 family ATPase